MSIKKRLSNLSPKITRALTASHDALNALGIPHVVIGGLAVNLRGVEYGTKDVDYLVRTEDAFTGALIASFKPGVPIKVEDVDIDYVTPDSYPGIADALASALADAETSAKKDPDAVAVIPIDALIYMKLIAGRAKDTAAVVELLKAGVVDIDATEELFESTVSSRKRDLVKNRWQKCLQLAKDEG